MTTPPPGDPTESEGTGGWPAPGTTSGGPGPRPLSGDPVNPSPGTIPGAGRAPLAPGTPRAPSYEAPFVPPGQVSLSTMAVASVVLGLLWIGGIGSVFAIALGLIARKETSSGTRRGSGAATLGIVLGVIGIAASVAVGVALAGGSGSDTNAAPTTAAGQGGSSVVATTTTAPAGPTTEKPGPIGRAQSFSCDYDLKGLQTAVETYEAVEDAVPTSMQDLIDTGYIASRPSWYTIDPPIDGKVNIKVNLKGQAVGCLPP